MLTAKEIIKLKKVLIRDNKIIDNIRYACQFIGKGGSNTYNRNGDLDVYNYPLRKLKGRNIEFWDYRYNLPDSPKHIAIAAVVEDVLYLLKKDIYECSDGTSELSYTVYGLRVGERLYDYESEISYDTDWSFDVRPESCKVKPELPFAGPFYIEHLSAEDLAPEGRKELLHRRYELMVKIREYEYENSDVNYLFCGWKNDYFNAAERAEEIEYALKEIKRKGTIERFNGQHWTYDFDHEFHERSKNEKGFIKEFEKLLREGLVLYKAVAEIDAQIKREDAAALE